MIQQVRMIKFRNTRNPYISGMSYRFYNLDLFECVLYPHLNKGTLLKP